MRLENFLGGAPFLAPFSTTGLQPVVPACGSTHPCPTLSSGRTSYSKKQTWEFSVWCPLPGPLHYHLAPARGAAPPASDRTASMIQCDDPQPCDVASVPVSDASDPQLCVEPAKYDASPLPDASQCEDASQMHATQPDASLSSPNTQSMMPA